MDSLTQAALGAGVAAICVPPEHRRRALLVGMGLGTLPDLDVLIDYGDAVANFTYHRGFSHSLFVLPPFAVVLWLALRRWWAPVRAAPGRWLAAILLALTTHPLLDAHTAYGTQLLWPLDTPPVAWSTLFIIDPLFTLPLLVGIAAAALWPKGVQSRRVLATAVALSVAYLGWSWAAKMAVEANARESLAASKLDNAPMFSTPAPFNTLLWRVVVLTDGGYLEIGDSLLVEEEPLEIRAISSGAELLQAAQHVWAVPRLQWFADGFVKAEVVADELIVTDLRMGWEPKYVFRHAVAEKGNPGWHAIPTRQVRTLFGRDDLAAVWGRLFET